MQPDETIRQTGAPPAMPWKKNAALFLISQQFSIFGSSVAAFGILWYVTLETSSGNAMTGIILASFLPQVFTALLAGVWADRYNRKLLILLPDLFIALSTLVLVILLWQGVTSLSLLVLVSALRSFAQGIQMPSVSALLPQLVPADKLVRINGIASTLTSVLQLAAPAAAGILLGSLGISFTLLTDVVTALLAVLTLLFLRVPALKRAGLAGEEKRGPFRDLADGLRYTRNHPFLLRLLVSYALVYFLITPAAFLTPLLIERSYGPEVWRLTFNEIFWTGGMLLGGVFIAVKGRFSNKFRVMFWCTIAFGISFGMLGVVSDFGLYLALLVAGGLFMPAYSTASTVLVQEHVEEGMMGRVFSLVSIIASVSLPAGMVVFGPLGDIFSVESIMVVSGALLVCVAPLALGCRLPKD